jgi:hypothetical protein
VVKIGVVFKGVEASDAGVASGSAAPGCVPWPECWASAAVQQTVVLAAPATKALLFRRGRSDVEDMSAPEPDQLDQQWS